MFSAGSSSTWRDQGRTATQGISHLVRPVAKSQGGDEREICCKSRRHLYLVFDDWKFGYSIRKLCLFPRSCCDQQTALSGQPVLRSLPPPLIRLVAPRCCPKYFVSAFGPRILAMHPRDPGGDSSERYFPMFDVCSLGVTSGPGQEHPINPIYLPVGENLLFTLSTASFEALSFKMLCPAMVGEYCSTDCSMEWSLKELPSQPFKFVDVTSYSLYPDQTLFFSTKMATTVATFAFDIQALSWKRLGKWAMPFVGRAHFDPQLGAFVGLSEDPGTLGQLCSCGLPSSDTGDGQCPAPVSLLCKEKLFSEEPAERHVSATLIYMGRKSKFSLVECVSIEEDSADQALIEEGDVRLPGRCLYRVTTFFLSHEENGDLKISKDGKVQYCPVPEDTTKWFLSEDPVAFWM